MSVQIREVWFEALCREENESAGNAGPKMEVRLDEWIDRSSDRRMDRLSKEKKQNNRRTFDLCLWRRGRRREQHGEREKKQNGGEEEKNNRQKYGQP